MWRIPDKFMARWQPVFFQVRVEIVYVFRIQYRKHHMKRLCALFRLQWTPLSTCFEHVSPPIGRANDFHQLSCVFVDNFRQKHAVALDLGGCGDGVDEQLLDRLESKESSGCVQAHDRFHYFAVRASHTCSAAAVEHAFRPRGRHCSRRACLLQIRHWAKTILFAWLAGSGRELPCESLVGPDRAECPALCPSAVESNGALSAFCLGSNQALAICTYQTCVTTAGVGSSIPADFTGYTCSGSCDARKRALITS